MRKWVLISIIAIFFLAIFMRLFPLTQYEIWGSDSGEYYYISTQLAGDGFVSTDYNGWGLGYPHFPGMFYLTGSVDFIFGLDTLSSMIFFVPFAASFSVLLVFLLARNLFKNDGAGLLAGALTAVAMPHVFATSHPMPASLGDMFLVLSLLLFLMAYNNRRFLPLLILSSIALIVTHPLSSYFFFIMGLGGLFAVEVLKKKEKTKSSNSWIFLVFYLTVLIMYWSLAAEPFSRRVVSDAFDYPVWMILSLGYVAIILAFLMIKLRRRSEWRYEPRFPEPKIQLFKYVALLISLFLILAIVSFTAIPGTNIELNPLVLLLFAPFLALVAFGSVGPGYIRFYKKGVVIWGWIIAIFLSALVGAATSNLVLLPFRHPQFLVVPLALLMGIGAIMLFNVLKRKRSFVRVTVFYVLWVLIFLSALSAYPPKDIMGGFQEGTSREDMQGVFWARESFETGATVASDHRMSSMVFGFGGLNATWDEAQKTLHGEDLSEFGEELESLDIPSGTKAINYVLLDDDIKEGAALHQWENAEPLSQKAQDKFHRWPFVKLYEAGGVEVYGIVD
jgi:hypothetical protein